MGETGAERTVRGGSSNQTQRAAAGDGLEAVGTDGGGGGGAGAKASAAAAWAPAMLQRVERCLKRRLDLAGCRLVDALLAPPARSGDWSDEFLGALLHSGGVGAGMAGGGGGGARGAGGGEGRAVLKRVVE